MLKIIEEKLDKNQKEWFAKAILNMIISDKKIAQGELAAAKDSLLILGLDDKMSTFVELIQHSGSLKTGPIEPNPGREIAIMMIMELGKVAASDLHIAMSEVEIIEDYAELLDLKDITDDIVHWVYLHKQLREHEEK